MADPIDLALDEARRRYSDARPRTAALHAEARAAMPGGNTRTVLYHGPFPLRVEQADGSEITDVDGHRYVDLLGNFSAGLFGHSNPAITAAVTAALERGLGPGMHGEAEVALAWAVCERFRLERVRFTNSGTEANLMALAAARAFTGRDRVLVFSGGYHGGVLSFPAGTEGSAVNAPFDVQVVPYNDVDAATQVLEGRDVAAVLVEPMLGASGCIPGTPEFLRGVRSAADSAGTLFVLDEVMTSRLGPAGLGQQLGLRPDLVTLGKYLGGGLSFGAFGGRAEVMDLFDPSRPDALAHAGTFNNNLASMLAGRAALRKVYPPDVAEAHTQRGERLREALNEAVGQRGLLATGVGSLMTIHPLPSALRENGSGVATTAEDVAGCDPRLRELLFLGLLERGYYIAPRGYLALSLAVTDEHLAGFVEAAGEVAAGLADLANQLAG